MSNYHYFECLEHTPALRSVSEFTQHNGDEAFRRGIELALSRPVELLPDGVADTVWNYYEGNAREFLSRHPNCPLGIVNELDERQPVEQAGVRVLSGQALILEHEISELQMVLDGKRARLEGLEEKLTEMQGDDRG